jgi:hypothetical protein
MKPMTMFSWGYYGWGNATAQFVQAADAAEAARGFAPPMLPVYSEPAEAERSLKGLQAEAARLRQEHGLEARE